jgi:hypothetical protein
MLRASETFSSRLLNWIGRHEFSTLLTIVGIAGGAWLFGVIADDVIEGGTQIFDRSVLLAIRNIQTRFKNGGTSR